MSAPDPTTKWAGPVAVQIPMLMSELNRRAEAGEDVEMLKSMLLLIKKLDNRLRELATR